jgi:endonuclease/exonuclease/phosphatase (EEP) superfamily protein YafD
LLVACWLYIATVLALYVTMRLSSSESWLPHLLLYCPRWPVSVPTLLLVPLVVRMRLRWTALGLAVAAITFFGIWGFNILYETLMAGRMPWRPGLRLLTFNVQGGDLNVQGLEDVIRVTQPDFVLLQEYGHVDPGLILGGGTWYVRTAGEFCLASRQPIVSFETLPRPDKPYRTIAVRAKVSWFGQTLPIVSVHLMTPRVGIEAILDGKWRGVGAFREIAAVQRYESALVRSWVEDSPGSIVLAGDFNLTSEHPLFRRDWSNYTDAFSRTSWGLGHTMFTNRIGLRIDHILCGERWRPIKCWVVGTDLGSAHRAVIADLLEDGHGEVPSPSEGDTTGATWRREASSTAAPLLNASVRRANGHHRGDEHRPPLRREAVRSTRATQRRPTLGPGSAHRG